MREDKKRIFILRGLSSLRAVFRGQLPPLFPGQMDLKLMIQALSVELGPVILFLVLVVVNI